MTLEQKQRSASTEASVVVDARRPVHLIINPHSGHGGKKMLLADLRLAMRRAGIEMVEYTTTAPEDATRYARSVGGSSRALLVWGGDGTVNEVANAVAGMDVPILPCPAGTENLLAKELRIPSNPAGIVEVLQAGQVVECDVGRVNNENFMLIIGVGFDAEVVRRLTKVRNGHISHLTYFWPMWRTFWEHDFPRIKIIADGREIFDDYGLAFVGNISRYAVGLRICRDAIYDDGELDLVVFSCQEQGSLLLHAAWTLLRLHPLKGNVLYRKVRNVRIETDRPVLSQVDGDPGPVTPLDISVSPTRMKLLVPPPHSGRAFWPWTR
ncbi:MAG: diacylglycerol kinase family lipid kinase [Planctomycetaceae bacterium]|nr:MAG: diacylglycerol kinase family lipid kinase [Planctomycetaceae bacterium]